MTLIDQGVKLVKQLMDDPDYNALCDEYVRQRIEEFGAENLPTEGRFQLETTLASEFTSLVCIGVQIT